jgi:hypothetical protein
LVETLVAISILYMALENIVGSNLQRRWMITFAFGLIHGFAFSFVLRETLQFAGSHLLTALLGFNIGIELGQLLVIVVLVPMLGVLFRLVPERIGTIILSAFVAHTAWTLDDRARRAAASVSVAGARRRLAGERDAWLMAILSSDACWRWSIGRCGARDGWPRMTNGPRSWRRLSQDAGASLGCRVDLPPNGCAHGSRSRRSRSVQRRFLTAVRNRTSVRFFARGEIRHHGRLVLESRVQLHLFESPSCTGVIASRWVRARSALHATQDAPCCQNMSAKRTCLDRISQA